MASIDDSRDALANARTFLYVGADDERKVGKALGSAADAVILDLEDAVAPDRRPAARAALARALDGREIGPVVLVRINGVDTDDCARDIAALDGLAVDAIVVPKAAPEGLRGLDAGGRPVVALVETSHGVLRAAEIAEIPAVARLMLGPFDLSAEIGCDPADQTALLLARSQLVLASAAAGLAAPIDGPCQALTDTDAVREETERARRLGFGAKSCVHPAQLAPAAAALAPSREDLVEARRIAAAYEAAMEDGSAVVALDGRMVEPPVVLRAHRLLAADRSAAS